MDGDLGDQLHHQSTPQVDLQESSKLRRFKRSRSPCRTIPLGTPARNQASSKSCDRQRGVTPRTLRYREKLSHATRDALWKSPPRLRASERLPTSLSG